MRILVISDIHANRTSLEAVLADAGEVDRTWCLGDLIGYGPDPDDCVEIIRKIPNLTCIKGNHDVASLDSSSLAIFNADARRSLEIVTAFYHSSETHTEVRLPIPADHPKYKSWVPAQFRQEAAQ